MGEIGKLELYKHYSYSNLEDWFDQLINIDPNAIWYEYGPNEKIEVGQNFIVIVCTITYSFVLDGYIEDGPNKGSQYKLIYKE